jgi:hypothetical protein
VCGSIISESYHEFDSNQPLLISHASFLVKLAAVPILEKYMWVNEHYQTNILDHLLMNLYEKWYIIDSGSTRYD